MKWLMDEICADTKEGSFPGNKPDRKLTIVPRSDEGIEIRMAVPNRFSTNVPRQHTVILMDEELERLKYTFVQVKIVMDFRVDKLSAAQVSKMFHVAWNNMIVANYDRRPDDLFGHTFTDTLIKVCRVLGVDVIESPETVRKFEAKLQNGGVPRAMKFEPVGEHETLVYRLIEILIDTVI